ncbi:MAG: fumarylacetoacetate hydrolase family protein [Thermaerobacterales bacterium]
MRLASLRDIAGAGDGGGTASVAVTGGFLPIADLNRIAGSSIPDTMLELIAGDKAAATEITAALERVDPKERDAAVIPAAAARFSPPYRRPGKIWGIGLNYAAHAGDLDEQVPAQPASFMKPWTTIIGPGDTILLPPESQRVTAEAELAVIIGRRCRQLSRAEAPSVIFGYTCVIDMTAEDILRQNPRYLTRAKSFDTFFSFGPVVLTVDEVPDLRELTVRTIVNDAVRAENTVAHMTFDPYELVAFHSQVMTLEPGDIISTGTPGAWPLAGGDRVRCEITGFPSLENPVAAAPSMT